jgi:REP element-mobilizing transposase RayT
MIINLSTGYKISGDGIYFLTFQIVGWVDIFTRKVYRDIILESLQYCQKSKSLNLFAYVIMSNHVHLIAQSDIADLSGTIRDFKSFTSCRILENIVDPSESRYEWLKIVFEYHGKFKNKQDNQVWTNDNHPEYIISQKFLEQKISYIHNNPVRSGLVRNPEEYLYSSASNYADMDSLLDVIKIGFLWKTVK